MGNTHVSIFGKSFSSCVIRVAVATGLFMVVAGGPLAMGLAAVSVVLPDSLTLAGIGAGAFGLLGGHGERLVRRILPF